MVRPLAGFAATPVAHATLPVVIFILSYRQSDTRAGSKWFSSNHSFPALWGYKSRGIKRRLCNASKQCFLRTKQESTTFLPEQAKTFLVFLNVDCEVKNKETSHTSPDFVSPRDAAANVPHRQRPWCQICASFHTDVRKCFRFSPPPATWGSGSMVLRDFGGFGSVALGVNSAACSSRNSAQTGF